MDLVYSPANVPARGAGNWVAIGKWDGLHLGHQAIVRALVEQARAAGGQSVVLGFHPLPMALLKPADAPKPVQTLEERTDALRALGVDVHLVIPFTRELAATSAEAFTNGVLLDALRARKVMVGFNHTFGRGGQGTAQTLQELCSRRGVPVQVFHPVREAGETISSTAVRYRLTAGEMAAAAEMLGRPFSLSGPVVPGDQRGRTIGYPTANLALDPGRHLPALGVYAVRVAVLPPGRHYLWPGTGARYYGGMLNLGLRPTFQGSDLRCEVHLHDFTGDLYGQRLQVEFAVRLRPERAFPGIDALVAQLRQDEQASRAALRQFDPGLLV